jgi:hypothetical protein
MKKKAEWSYTRPILTSMSEPATAGQGNSQIRNNRYFVCVLEVCRNSGH